MPEDRYDLTVRPWIPATARADLDHDQLAELHRLTDTTARPGQTIRLSLTQLLDSAHLLEHLANLDPGAETALLRILIAVTARVTGLDTDTSGDWGDCRWDVLEAGKLDPTRIRAYLDAHEGRWVLYDPVRPWLQDPRMRDECTGSSGTGRLVMTVPSGNNHLWWPIDKDAAAKASAVPSQTAVLSLLTWLYSGPSGTASNRQHPTMPKASKSMVAGPVRSAVSWFPLGSNLFETLAIAIPAPDTWPTNPGPDLAPWETDQLPDPMRPAAPTGIVSLLTARYAHGILLQPNKDMSAVTDTWITWGWQGTIPDAEDPYLIYRQENGPVRASISRAFWRDLDALLLKTRPGVNPARRPAAFQAIADLPTETTARLRVRALGLDQDGQVNNTAWYSATTPPVLGHLEETDPDGAAVISTARAHAEAVAARMRSALRQAWREATNASTDCPWTEPATSLYWAQAEAEFWAVVNATGAERPRPRFQRIATAVYDATTAETASTTRGMHAVELARAVMLALPKASKQPAKA
ncbi:type I-E CRISPR-associated protein Cse1/CasA [Streptacidiphilus sp. MAP5-3]|uniref:type I-E CRISPR-associated protein Cse1/CasA n=1 Tax=unclassified Streptacidiphilus TaxID=2643834 RepID=UPI00351892DA